MKKVFVLESAPHLGLAMQQLMHRMGVLQETVLAENVNDGLQELMKNKFQFDAALIDYDLPDEPGTTLVETLRRRAPNCSIVIFCQNAGADNDTTRLIKRWKPDVLLNKPCDCDWKTFAAALVKIGLIKSIPAVPVD